MKSYVFSCNFFILKESKQISVSKSGVPQIISLLQYIKPLKFSLIIGLYIAGFVDKGLVQLIRWNDLVRITSTLIYFTTEKLPYTRVIFFLLPCEVVI